MLKLLFLVRTPIQAFPWWAAFSGTHSFLPPRRTRTDRVTWGGSQKAHGTSSRSFRAGRVLPANPSRPPTGARAKGAACGGRAYTRRALRLGPPPGLPPPAADALSRGPGHDSRRGRTPSEGRTVPRYLCASSERACVCPSGGRGVALSSAREL